MRSGGDWKRCRQDQHHGTQECVRHVGGFGIEEIAGEFSEESTIFDVHRRWKQSDSTRENRMAVPLFLPNMLLPRPASEPLRRGLNTRQLWFPFGGRLEHCQMLEEVSPGGNEVAVIEAELFRNVADLVVFDGRDRLIG